MEEAGYEWDAEKKELRKVEQEPDWSEEDEQMYIEIIYILAGFRGNEVKLDWLKSIKDRVQPQKQEWSDVDKDILFRTINNLKFLRDTISIDPKYVVNIIDIEREITWLKSLRPQNWKPSEEQMRALNEVVNYAANHENMHWNDYIFGTLNGLVKQLKNLTE